MLRPYVRFSPIPLGKGFLFNRVLEPLCAWDSIPYVTKTVFQSQVAGQTKDLIQKYIYYFGVWEPNLTQWITRQLKPGDTFIDVGANIGYFTLLASRLVGEKGSVVSIEASPTIFSALRANISRNNLKNVRAVNKAVFHRRTMVKVFMAGDDNTGKTTILEDSQFALESEVEAELLSELLSAAEVCNARVVKIDVEGAIWPVLEGITRLLHDGRRDLEFVVEVDPGPLAAAGKTPGDVLDLFAGAGLHAYLLENIYTPDGYLPPYRLKRPVRLRSPINEASDLVFSRRDAEEL